MMKSKRLAVAATVILAFAVGAIFWGKTESSQQANQKSSVRGIAASPSSLTGSSVVSASFALPTNQTATVRGTKPYVLRSEEDFQQPLRLAVESLGARTIGVLSPRALLIEADAVTRQKLAADRRFAELAEFLPAAKVQPGLMAVLRAGKTAVEASIVALAQEDRDRVVRCVEGGGGEILRGCLNAGTLIRARLTSEQVVALAARGDVRWMELFDRPQVMNDYAVEPQAMNVRPTWVVHGLSGAGQRISTSDSGIDTGDTETMHADLKNQILAIKVVDGCNTQDVLGHGTHTAGSIVGDGTLSGDAKSYPRGPVRGTAWGAKLYAWFCGVGESSVATPKTCEELFRGEGGTEWSDAFIHSASWGNNSAGAYNARCAMFDKYLWENPDFLPVVSAGNAGIARRTIGSPASAKNVLAVGATQNLRPSYPLDDRRVGDPDVTAEYSSCGPCADGRIKPDIAAPGSGILSTRSYQASYDRGVTADGNYAYECGTSMACPLTAGAVALVREWLCKRDEYQSEPPTAAMMKAVITGGAKGAATPNVEQGWGRVDLAETLFPSNRAVKLVDRIPFTAGEEFCYVIETTNAAPLDVQLAWVDHPGLESAEASAPKLVNDLDLTVEALKGGSGDLLYGNGGTSADRCNNMESVRISDAEPDLYVIRVKCASVVYDYQEGGAAALYVRGAFDPEVTPKGDGSVRIVRGVETNEFFSLDKALGSVQANDTVEILKPVNLRKSCALSVPCTLMATNVDARVSSVCCLGDATLNVDSGARVLFKNVSFTNSTEYVKFSVAEGGTAAVSGYVGVQEFQTADAGGFELAGKIDTSFFLSCDGKTEATDIIGMTSVSEPELEGCAGRIRNKVDEELGAAVDGGNLIWAPAPVDDVTAVVRLIRADGTTVNYMSLRTLFKYGADAASIVICKNCRLTTSLTVNHDMTLASSNGTHTITATNMPDCAGFLVTAGTLTVSNVVLRGYTGPGLLTVAGEGAGLVLGEGARLTDLKGVQANDGKVLSGAVTAGAGTVTLLPGCEIDHCEAWNGGAIALQDYASCRLNLFGGSIHDCVAKAYGGGIYAGYGSTVRVKGDARVRGNVRQPDLLTEDQPDDLCFYELEDGVLVVVGDLTSDVCSIGLYDSGNPDNNLEGAAFASVQEGVDAAAAAARFFCNAPMKSGNTLVGEADGQTLVWKDGGKRVNPSEAKVLVIYPDATTNYYLTVADAFGSLTADDSVIVELLEDLSFDQDLTVSGVSVLLRSQTEAGTLTRSGDVSIVVREGTRLTIAGLAIDGGGAATTRPLLLSVGGDLVLEDKALIQNVVCTAHGENGYRGAGVVMLGGSLIMRRGAVISNCSNTYASETAIGEGAGIWTSGTSVLLEGGLISDCRAGVAGGMYCFNGELRISGEARIRANVNDPSVDGVSYAPNLAVNGSSVIRLTGAFSGSVGVDAYDGVDKITNVFGSVETNYLVAAGEQELADSAKCFFYDGATETVTGCVVTNGTAGLLVWRSALKTDPDTGARYYEDAAQTRYGLVGKDDPEPVYVDPDPIAFKSVTRVSDTEWSLVVTDRVQWAEYRLIWTDDLTKGFTATGAWEQAEVAGPWTTNVLFVAPAPAALFWKAEAQRGTKPTE